MIEVSEQQHIGFELEQVFEASLHLALWPKFAGMSMEYAEERLNNNAALRLGLQVAHKTIGIDCRVKELLDNQRIYIYGRSPVAEGALSFGFRSNDDGGTTLEYGLQFGLRGLGSGLLENRLRPKVLARRQEFTDRFRGNIVQYLLESDI